MATTNRNPRNINANNLKRAGYAHTVTSDDYDIFVHDGMRIDVDFTRRELLFLCRGNRLGRRMAFDPTLSGHELSAMIFDKTEEYEGKDIRGKGTVMAQVYWGMGVEDLGRWIPKGWTS